MGRKESNQPTNFYIFEWVILTSEMCQCTLNGKYIAAFPFIVKVRDCKPQEEDRLHGDFENYLLARRVESAYISKQITITMSYICTCQFSYRFQYCKSSKQGAQASR